VSFDVFYVSGGVGGARDRREGRGRDDEWEIREGLGRLGGLG